MLLKDQVILLTVYALSGEHASAPSVPVAILREDFLHVCRANKTMADESEVTSSATSLSSIEDEEDGNNPATGMGFRRAEVDIVTVETNGMLGDTMRANGRHNGHQGTASVIALKIVLLGCDGHTNTIHVHLLVCHMTTLLWSFA